MSKKIETVSVKSVKDVVDPPGIVRSLQEKIKLLTRELDSIKKEAGSFEEFEWEIMKGIKKFEPANVHFKTMHVSKKVSSPVIPVLHLSDWHIGEIVREDLVEGFNTFSYSVAKARVESLAKSFISWVNLHKMNYKIDEIYVIDTGDNISGDIHDELRITNEWPVPEQIIRAAGLKAELLRNIATICKKLNVVYIVPDNHSRKTQKVQFKNAGINSENYLVGFITKAMLADIKVVNFKIELSPTARVEINKQVYLCEHGNNIRGWAGIPYYGMDRSTAREAKRRMMNMKGFNKMILGHFHVPMNSQYYMVNGSLSGTNEFDHACGRHAAPSQCAWMIHPKHGEFDWLAFTF